MIRAGRWHDVSLVDQRIWWRLCLRCCAKAPESSTLGVRWSMRGHDLCDAKVPNQSCNCLAKDHLIFWATCACTLLLRSTFAYRRFLFIPQTSHPFPFLTSSIHSHPLSSIPSGLQPHPSQHNFISSIIHCYGSYQADCPQEHWWQSSP